MSQKAGTDGSDGDPSFIRKNAAELFEWARRVGLSHKEVRDAVDSGLIRPPQRAGATATAGRERPQQDWPENWG